MKKVKLSVLALLAVAAIAPSCKKGENDPALSLRSRKARVAGEWKVSSYENTWENSSTPTSGTASSNSGTTTHDGATYSASSTNTSGGTSTTSTTTGTVSANTYTFEKDGTWSSVFNYTTTDVQTNNYSSGSYTYIVKTTTVRTYENTNSGNWNFTGKIGEAKNKEYMSVVSLSGTSKVTTNTKTETTTGSGTTTTTTTESSSVSNNNTDGVSASFSSLWRITQLKNKEMLVEQVDEDTNTGSSSNTSGGTTTTTTNPTNKSKSTVKMTLVQE